MNENPINPANLSICIPSYRRPDNVLSWAIFKKARYYIAESEVESYRSNYPEMIIRPVHDAVQGNIARVRNYILDNEAADVIAIVDDDFKYLGLWQDCSDRHITDEIEIRQMIARYSEMAVDLGCRLWGVNLNTDKQLYMEHSPFSLRCPVLAPFSVHLRPERRYDEAIPLKEDYDFFIQNMNRYRRVLRVNFYYYHNLRGQQAGGCSLMRTTIEEARQLDLLQKKWGSKIVRLNRNVQSHQKGVRKRAQDDIINPSIKIPIRGV